MTLRTNTSKDKYDESDNQATRYYQKRYSVRLGTIGGKNRQEIVRIKTVISVLSIQNNKAISIVAGSYEL